MDLEMPGGEPAKSWLMTDGPKKVGNGGDWLSPEKVLPEVTAGKITTATLDDNVGSILRTMFVSGVFDRAPVAAGEIDTPAQRAVARHGAAESIVLLKNDGAVLPLDPSKVRSLAVIGPNAAVARTGGGGSSLVRSNYAVAPLDGIRERAGSNIQVSYALGASIEEEGVSGAG